jgi:PAS domain S-box-containing protein
MFDFTRRRFVPYIGLMLFASAIMMVASDWARRNGFISRLSEDVTQLVSWCLFLLPMLIFTFSTAGTRNTRRAAVLAFTLMLVGRFMDIADELKFLHSVPLVGADSSVGQIIQRGMGVLTTAALLLVVVLFYDQLARGTANTRESNARFQNLFDNMPTVCFTFDRSGRILSWNRAAEKLYGYTAEEAIGAGALSILVTPDTLDAAQRTIASVFAGRSMLGAEWYDLDKEGQLGCRLRSAFPLFRDDGSVECGVTMIVDVSDRRKVEADLAQSRHERELIADNVPALLAHFDSNLRYRFVNSRYAEWMGKTPEEILALHPRDLLGETAFQRALPHFEGVLKGVTQEYENAILRPDGSMSYTHVNLVPDHDDQGHVVGFYVMVKDITQQKLAEREAENERMLLRNLLNLQERERQTVSHDIHDGIVQYIVGAQMQVEACEATLDPSDEATAAKLTLASEHLRAAVREGRRLISGLRPPIIDESGLVAAIEHLMGDLERQEGLRVDFDHVGVDRPLPAHLETAVFRIVQEALTNVARHSQAKYALVELEGTPDRIVADVCDNGRGFDRSAVPLDRFGLRGIEERARLFGGHAQIDSEPGQGTRIHVELPCEMHEPPPAPREEALPAAENLPI